MRPFQDVAEGASVRCALECIADIESEQIYSFDPLANLSKSEQKLVIGGGSHA